MRISKKAQREAKRLFRDCLVDARLDEGRVRAVLGRVAQAKPRAYLAILTHFGRLVRLEIQRRRASIESAGPLAAALRTSLESNLNRLYGPALDFAFAERPELLGGLRVQVGSDVYDGTVRYRLECLREQF